MTSLRTTGFSPIQSGLVVLAALGILFQAPLQPAVAFYSELGAPVASAVLRQDDQESAAESPKLAWQFETGQIFTFDFQQSTSMSTMVAENPDTKNGTSEQRMLIQWKVLSADQDSASIEMTYQQVDFAIDIDGRATASTDPDRPSVGNGSSLRLVRGMIQSVKPLLNQPIILTVSKDGSISKLEIEQSVVDAIIAAPNTMALRDNLTKEGIESIMGSFLVPLPEDTSKPWQRQSETKINQLPLKSTTTYKLEESAATDASDTVIAFETQISFPTQFLKAATSPDELKNQKLKKNQAPFDFDPIAEKWPRIARQEASGKIHFDANLGYPTSAKSRTILVTEKAQSNFLIETTLDTTTEVKITRQ